MPSEYSCSPSTPGYRLGSPATGVCDSAAGKVWVSLPLGLASPNNSRLVASAPSCPGYHMSRTAATPSTHGIVTDEAVFSTTTVLGLTSAIAEMRSSWLPGRDRKARSAPSVLLSKGEIGR